MAQEIFKRTEKKYLLSAQQYRAFLAALEPFVKRDRYFESDIMSLYYDTPDYRLIRASIEKPVFKEKIRLRSYGVPRSADDVFLEIKRKYKGVVYKRRSVMPLSRAAGFPETTRDTQIEKELAWCFDFYEGLAPQMLITYKRHAYTALSDPELRITFDSELLFRDYDLRLDKGIYGRKLLPHGERIMEIKIAGAIPLWLTGLLDELKIYPASYSKYGTAYLTLLSEKALGLNKITA
jgi:hypothetical protein